MAQSAAHFKRPAQLATEPQAKRETRSVLRHSLVVDSTERGRRHCSGEFEQLLLTCIEGCGLRSNTNGFKVRTAAAIISWHAHCTCIHVLTIDLRTVQLGR